MENKTKKKGLLDRITSSRVFRVMFSRKIIVVCAILLLIMVLIAIFAPAHAEDSHEKANRAKTVLRTGDCSL